MPKLILMDAAGNVRQVPLVAPATTLGRGASCDVVLDSKRASREHALIEVDGPKAFIVDLHSLNGTLVNGELIDRHQLAHGDSIEIGTVEMRLGNFSRSETLLKDVLKTTEKYASDDYGRVVAGRGRVGSNRGRKVECRRAVSSAASRARPTSS